MNDEIEKMLQEHNVRPTAVRILVWRTIKSMTYAFSLADMESKLLTVDRSTLFRTLTLFAENDLLDTIDDGSGQKKYCQGHHDGQSRHIHFTCIDCGHTTCVRSQPIPLVQMPEGYVVQQVSYVAQGLCPACAEKRIRKGTL